MPECKRVTLNLQIATARKMAALINRQNNLPAIGEEKIDFGEGAIDTYIPQIANHSSSSSSSAESPAAVKKPVGISHNAEEVIKNETSAIKVTVTPSWEWPSQLIVYGRNRVSSSEEWAEEIKGFCQYFIINEIMQDFKKEFIKWKKELNTEDSRLLYKLQESIRPEFDKQREENLRHHQEMHSRNKKWSTWIKDRNENDRENAQKHVDEMESALIKKKEIKDIKNKKLIEELKKNPIGKADQEMICNYFLQSFISKSEIDININEMLFSLAKLRQDIRAQILSYLSEEDYEVFFCVSCTRLREQLYKHKIQCAQSCGKDKQEVISFFNKLTDVGFYDFPNQKAGFKELFSNPRSSIHNMSRKGISLPFGLDLLYIKRALRAMIVNDPMQKKKHPVICNYISLNNIIKSFNYYKKTLVNANECKELFDLISKVNTALSEKGIKADLISQ